MFDFFKKKSYTVTQENGMEKLVTAADMNKAAEDALKALEALPENYIKDLIDYTKSSIDHGNISKEFLKMIIKIVDAVSTKKAKEVQKSLDDEAPAPKPKEEKKEEPKKEEESKEELKKDDILDLDKVASVNKESIVRSAADTNPASSKYRAEGIKEKLLEINKEVAVKSDNKVQNIGNNTKGIITPGDKSTVVKVKEETVKPDIVVENVKIKIIRDEGEFEKLFPEKNIKFPTGDKVVIKASQDVEIDTAKLQTKSEEEKKEVGEAMQSGDPTKIKQVVEKTGVGKTGTASIYDQVMNTVFNRSAEADTEDTDKFEEEVKEDLSLLNNKE
jgi:hypothetical protein